MTQQATTEDPLQHLADLELRTGSSDPPDDSSPDAKKPEDGTETPSDDKDTALTLEELQTKLEESAAREKTLEQKVKSAEGRSKKEASDRSLLEDLRDRQSATEKSLGLFITSGANGNEELTTELGKVQLEEAKARNERVEVGNIERIKTALLETIYEDPSDQSQGLRVSKEQAAQLVAKWKATTVTSDLISVVTDAVQMVTANERTKAKESEKRAREEEKAAAKQEKEDSGFGEMDAGTGSGGSDSTSSLSPVNKIAEGLKQGQGKSLFG